MHKIPGFRLSLGNKLGSGGCLDCRNNISPGEEQGNEIGSVVGKGVGLLSYPPVVECRDFRSRIIAVFPFNCK